MSFEAEVKLKVGAKASLRTPRAGEAAGGRCEALNIASQFSVRPPREVNLKVTGRQSWIISCDGKERELDNLISPVNCLE